MKKWTWQWLALIGLGWMMLGVFAFVQVDLLPLIPLIDEDAIKVYHEPLYYDHFLVKKVEEGRLKIADFIKNEKSDVHRMEAKRRASKYKGLFKEMGA